MIVFSALLPHFRLDARALIHETVNSDQFFEACRLILAIHKVLMAEGTS